MNNQEFFREIQQADQLCFFGSVILLAWIGQISIAHNLWIAQKLQVSIWKQFSEEAGEFLVLPAIGLFLWVNQFLQ